MLRPRVSLGIARLKAVGGRDSRWIVSGTISQKLAKPLLDLAAQFASISVEIPHFLVAVGACATSGGPYWDSDSIVAGVDALGLSCDLYIPGCPPRPSEILSGLVGLLDQVHVQ
jgi:NADH-quinone oxidoreductase subunit B